MTIFKKTGLLAVLLTGLLSGCGGGDDSPAAPAAAPVTPVAAAVTVSGVAATGAAITGGSVTLKCVSGTTAVVTTGADGSFSIDVSAVTLPCVGEVAYKDGTGATQKLHTFVSATGTANITPLTELMLASLTGGAAMDAFDKFDASKAKAITAAQVSTAIAAVKAYLVTLGVSVADFPADPVNGKFVAKAGSSSGDKADAVLDELASKLKAAGKKLGDAVTDINKGPDTPATGGTNTLVVSDASKASRNGSYSLAGGKFTSGTSDFGFNGQSADGKFEAEVVVTAGGAIKRAHVWFFDSGTTIKFFGCDNAKVACTGIGWEPLLKQIMFNTAKVAEVDADLSGTGAGDSLVTGGETLTLKGVIEVK